MKVLTIRFNTGGLLPYGRAIEVAAVISSEDLREISHFHYYMNTETDFIHPDAQAAHNISAEFLAQHGRNRAAVFTLFWTWLETHGVVFGKPNQLRILSHDTSNYTMRIFEDWAGDYFIPFTDSCAHTMWDTRQVAAYVNTCTQHAFRVPVYFSKNGMDSCCLYDLLKNENYVNVADHGALHSARGVAFLWERMRDKGARDMYELVESKKGTMERKGYVCPWCGASAHSVTENVYSCIICSGEWQILKKGDE